MKIISSTQKQVDLNNEEFDALRLELDRLFAEFTQEDGESYPRLRALFEILVDEKP